MEPDRPTLIESSPGLTMRVGEPEGNLKKYLTLAGLGLVFIFLGGIIWTIVSSPMLVTVTGTGEVTVPAEAATITFTIAASSPDAGSGISLVRNRASSIREILKSGGVAEGDIVESQVRVVPASTLVQGASGYQASISMGAKTVHVSDIESLIATLYANGATLVSQPLISVEESKGLEDKAMDEAMKDAKQRAGQIGRRNFKFIRKIVSVSQVSTPSSSTVTTKPDVVTESELPQTALSGVFKVRKTVSVTYKMW